MSEEGYNKVVGRFETVGNDRTPERLWQLLLRHAIKVTCRKMQKYDAAKEAQGLLEMKINKLKQVIADAKIIDESKLKNRQCTDIE